MLIKRYNITKITRNRFRLKLMIFKNIKNKLFSFTNGVKTPTNAYGNKTIRSRKKVTLKIFWNNINTTPAFSAPNLITQICFSYRIYKFISIIKNASGVIYSKITTESHKLFSYFLFLKNDKHLKSLSKGNIKFLPYNSFLLYTPRRSFISYVEIEFNKGFQYAKAVGSKARLLEIYKHKNLCAVQLPSKEVKIFSAFATCNNSLLMLKTNKQLQFDNKRYKKLLGFGPKVRGVAMNALDHPHGGKTKSIKFPKTPWGLATKLK